MLTLYEISIVSQRRRVTWRREIWTGFRRQRSRIGGLGQRKLNHHRYALETPFPSHAAAHLQRGYAIPTNSRRISCHVALMTMAGLRASALRAEETTASRIVSVSLFKNGLALVKREVTAPGPGVYRLDYVPEAVHGTYWVESTVNVESAVQMREVELPAEPTGANLQEELAGKRVTVYFREDRRAPLVGTVLPRPKKPAQPPGTDEPVAYREIAAQPSRFLIAKPKGGLT